MADHANVSSQKSGAFSKAYCLLLVGLVILVLGAFLFFAATRQSHSMPSPAGTQKGMVTLSHAMTAA